MVAGLGAPAGAHDSSDDAMADVYDEAVGLLNIVDLNHDAIDALRSTGCKIFVDQSYTAGMSYWMNHCTHCDAKIGDHYIHSSPGVAFFPTMDEDMARVTIRERRTPLQAVANPAIGIMQRIVDARLPRGLSETSNKSS